MGDISSKLPLFHVIGFTGHRQVDHPEKTVAIVASTLAELQRESPGNWVALSSVAAGSDQVFAREAKKAGLGWHVVLPLPRAEFAKDFTSTEWTAVEELLGQAEHVRVIQENGTRDDAYLDCGMEVVNGSDVLLALWDGKPARGRGGTADIIHYARALGRPLILIDATTLEVTKENFAALHQGDEHFAALNKLPAARTSWATNPFDAPGEIFAFQQKCDFAASHGAPQFRRLIVMTVVFHVLATIVAAAALAFDLHWLALPWLKLACLIGALIVAIALRQHHHHHNWVRCRLAAEFCRSALATWGLPRAAPLFQDMAFAGMRGLTRTLHILHSRSAIEQPVSLEKFRRVYLEYRIDDQLSYYRSQEKRALPLYRRLRLGFGVATILAIACTALYAIAHTWHWGILSQAGEEWVFYLLPIILPVIAAAFISFISINDLQRRVARYREMRVMLEDARKQLSFSPTWNSLERVVLRTERGLLQEVLEWHSITSFSESH
ncbi:hypothetical protein [Oleiharenicola lentus]|uniref:hypothetical protein n=1 Tax=Oleiharenicola lentus TaxID=2508720 RepID=UPI003F66A2FA